MADSRITMFSFLTNILRLKSRPVYEKHIALEEFDALYVPFMVTKWCSMVDDRRLAESLAEIQAALDELADDRRTHYLLLMQSTPKVSSNPRWVFDKTKTKSQKGEIQR